MLFVSRRDEQDEELSREIDDVLAAKFFTTRSDGERLRGRLQFASSDFWEEVQEAPEGPATQWYPHQESFVCLADISHLLSKNASRRVCASQSEILHKYVDASFDSSAYSGLGGFVLNMAWEQLFFFSAEVEKKVVDSMMSKGQRTIVQELETMAVLGALRSWREMISPCRVVLFTDSEAVRGSFLKSWSANEDSDRLMEVIFRLGLTYRFGLNEC